MKSLFSKTVIMAIAASAIITSCTKKETVLPVKKLPINYAAIQNTAQNILDTPYKNHGLKMVDTPYKKVDTPYIKQ